MHRCDDDALYLVLALGLLVLAPAVLLLLLLLLLIEFLQGGQFLQLLLLQRQPHVGVAGAKGGGEPNQKDKNRNKKPEA